VCFPGLLTQRGNEAGRTSAAVTRNTAPVATGAASRPGPVAQVFMPGAGGKSACAPGQRMPGARWAPDGRHHRLPAATPGAACPANESGEQRGHAMC